MTRSQEVAVKNIKKYIEENDLHKNHPDYEFKEFDVEETNYGAVVVYSVTGRKNDEGTMAAVLGRNTRHIFIGNHGGLRSYRYSPELKKTFELKGWIDVMVYGYKH